MLPIRDENPSRTTPFVTYLLIAVNVAVWLLEWWVTNQGVVWVIPGYGLVPARLMADPPGEAFTVFTSMFMHGGWDHLLGNMLFLWIFGDNIEDALGHFRFLIFYFAAGLAAAAAQVGIDPASTVPMVGASGAIAGVLGGYLVLYPRAPIYVLNPIPWLWLVWGALLVFPAWVVVGEWFVWNLLASLQMLGGLGGRGGGVAFFAHLGGFILGLVAVRPLSLRRERREPEPWHGFRPAERSPAGSYGGPRRDPWA
jgi:membrane associated rhomboid family serine protease